MADILYELQQKVAMKPSLEAKLRELQNQRKEYDREVISLRMAFRKEQEDVEKLEGRSLANYFFQVVGKLDEKLDKERRKPTQQRSSWMLRNGNLPVLNLTSLRFRLSLMRFGSQRHSTRMNWRKSVLR